MSRTNADAMLKLLLRLVGGVELCAIPFIFFPWPWMEIVHERLLHLGVLPNAPIVEYMARSLSALYALHGAIVFRLSMDLNRFRPLVGFLGYGHLLLGVIVTGIDRFSGLPWFWVLGEGPGIAVGGVLVLLLNRNVPAQVT